MPPITCKCRWYTDWPRPEFNSRTVLTTVLPFVDHDAVPVVLEQRVAPRHVRGHEHQVTQKRDVPLRRPPDPSEPGPLLGDHEEVAGRHGPDVPEG